MLFARKWVSPHVTQKAFRKIVIYCGEISIEIFKGPLFLNWYFHSYRKYSKLFFTFFFLWKQPNTITTFFLIIKSFLFFSLSSCYNNNSSRCTFCFQSVVISLEFFSFLLQLKWYEMDKQFRYAANRLYAGQKLKKN